MKFLVVSLRHELLPIAHRLRREGHEVEVIVWRPRYEAAWSGSLEKRIRHSDGTISGEELAPLIHQAEAGELVVITTVRRISELFRRAKLFYGPGPTQEHPERDPLWFGGWFDGEAIQAPHLLVCDWGPWTGGSGDPSVLGGISLIRTAQYPKQVESAADQVRERLKSDSFRGLFCFDLVEELSSGDLKLRGLLSGWPSLQTSVFIAEHKNHGQTVGGHEPPHLARRFVSVLPVTISPWPNEKRSQKEAGQPIEGLTLQQQGQCFWFDMRVDEERKKLLSAGLDGLLCIATGASDSTPALARARALELAHKIQIPGKQYRMDMGSLVDRVLSTLEDRYGYVV